MRHIEQADKPAHGYFRGSPAGVGATTRERNGRLVVAHVRRCPGLRICRMSDKGRSVSFVEPGRTYLLAQVAELLGKSPRALQAQLRRAAKKSDARVVAVTPWISAYRFCDGREWRFCSSEQPSSRLAEVVIAEPSYEDSHKKNSLTRSVARIRPRDRVWCVT